MEFLGKVADVVLALRVPDESMLSITTRQLQMTLGRHSPHKLAGLQVQGGNGSFILPPRLKSQFVATGIDATSFVDTQVRVHVQIGKLRKSK